MLPVWVPFYLTFWVRQRILQRECNRLYPMSFFLIYRTLRPPGGPRVHRQRNSRSCRRRGEETSGKHPGVQGCAAQGSLCFPFFPEGGLSSLGRQENLPWRSSIVSGPSPFPQEAPPYSLKVFSKREREVLELLFFNGVSGRKAVGILGISRSTVRSYRREALRKLREKVGVSKIS